MEIVNINMRTAYSGGAFSPAGAVRRAAEGRYSVCGISDDDCAAGAAEFIAAGKDLDVPVTIGMRTRVPFVGTPLSDKRLNYVWQEGLGRAAMYGIPHQNISRLNSIFSAYRAKRNQSAKLMCYRINDIVKPGGLTFSFERDGVAKYAPGGTVTESALCRVLALKISEKFGRGASLAEFAAKIGMPLSDPEANACGAEELTAVLEERLTRRFYVCAGGECMGAEHFLRVCRDNGAIAAYAYMGDGADGEFEDAHLDELIALLKSAGFNAVSYRPSRLTDARIERIRGLCREADLLELNGEEDAAPAQSAALSETQTCAYAHLLETAYALIGHEKETTLSQERAMFASETVKRMPSLAERTDYFSHVWRRSGG
jgi:hypothetical protein